MAILFYPSPIGVLRLESDGTALTRIAILKDGEEPHHSEDDSVLRLAVQELKEYFAGSRKVFKTPLSSVGSPFDRAVWAALMTVPFGETVSYGELAAMIGRPNAARAVGGAVGRNPILVMIPCHRVLAAGNRLGGFSAGLGNKRILLATESIAYRK